MPKISPKMLSKMPLETLRNHYPPLFLDYVAKKETLGTWYSAPPTLAGIQSRIAARQPFSQAQRNQLVERLIAQYKGIRLSSTQHQHLSRLREPTTYTLCTGQQLHITGGPLYVLFKVLSLIATCEALNDADAAHHYVPIFWLHGEDHDIEEVAQSYLGGQKMRAPLQGHGPVGPQPSAEISQWLQNLPLWAKPLREAYAQGNTIMEAHRHLWQYWLGAKGLLTLDASDAELKKVFVPVMQEHLLNPHALAPLHTTAQWLSNAGYAPLLPHRRPPLFYMTHTERVPLQIIDQTTVQCGERKWKKEHLQVLLETHPEHFSPNVVLRPLYQETLLPNVAYVGGPAEIAYWLELKPLFDKHKIPYPVLLPRHCGAFVAPYDQQRLFKWGINPADCLNAQAQIRAKILTHHKQPKHPLAKANKTFVQLKKETLSAFEAHAPALVPHAEAQSKRMDKLFGTMQRKLQQQQLAQYEAHKGALNALCQRLFPKGKLQERHIQWIEMAHTQPDLLQHIQAHIQPFEPQFHWHYLPTFRASK